jgi:polysaccharide biosynthesis/export protein VpsN
MKQSRFILMRLPVLLSLLLFALQLGCETTGSGSGTGTNPVGVVPSKGATDTTYSPGDKIILEFEQGLPPQWQQVVREDGSITLPLNKTVKAAGKQKGQLEEEILRIYVPNILKRLTVNVRSEERSYFVRGEVRLPGQKVHTGLITAMKAISAAGDFTDFAKKTDVEIIRASGEKIHMNAKKALKDPSRYDVPIFPGDSVHVNRRFF